MKAKYIPLCLSLLLLFTACNKDKLPQKEGSKDRPQVVVTMDAPTQAPVLPTFAPDSKLPAAAAPWVGVCDSLPFDYDLDGDGLLEQLAVTCTLGEDIVSYGLAVQKGEDVSMADTLLEGVPTLHIVYPQAAAVPLLLLEGTMGSDDIWLYVYAYEQGILHQLPVDGSYDPHYGQLYGNEPYSLQLGTQLDILGTRFAYGEYMQTDFGLALDGSLWHYAQEDWTLALCTKTELYLVLGEGDGNEESSEVLLPIGTKLLPVATDRSGKLFVRTDSGLMGYLPITVDDFGLCSTVCGLSEEEAFEPLFYAG